MIIVYKLTGGHLPTQNIAYLDRVLFVPTLVTLRRDTQATIDASMYLISPAQRYTYPVYSYTAVYSTSYTPTQHAV